MLKNIFVASGSNRILADAGVCNTQSQKSCIKGGGLERQGNYHFSLLELTYDKKLHFNIHSSVEEDPINQPMYAIINASYN